MSASADPTSAPAGAMADEPEAIRGWEALAAASGVLPTQDAPWATASAASFDGEPQFLVEGPAGAPEAIAPLVRAGNGLAPAGANRAVEPSDLLAASPDALAALAEKVVRKRLPLLFERVPAESPTVAALQEAVGRRGVVRVSEATGHPTLALDDERWTEPGGGLSSSRRSSLRRARRRAEKMGEVRIELLQPGPEEVESLLDTAFAVESRSWKSSNGTALIQVPEMAAFFRRYCTAQAERKALRIDLMHIAENAVAMQIGIEWQGRVWLFKVGYDEGFADASPGQVLLAESIAAAARGGLESYELLGSRSGWTDVWTKEVRPCTRIAVYPASRHGALGLARAGGGKVGQRAHGVASRTLRSMERVAQGRYVAGPDLAAALGAERHYAGAGYETTVGLWGVAADKVDDALQDAFDAAAALREGGELSIKLNSIGGERPELDELLARCRERDLTLHLDALALDTAEQALRTAGRLAELAPGEVGCTLPARWERSPADALEVRERPLRVRLVKGEWADPSGFDPDQREAYLGLADALAGRDRLVEVATQDATLAAAALERLSAAGTPCELQVLLGMPCRRAVREARRRDVPVRVYVPYGTGRLPYSLEDIERRPRALTRLAFDLLPLVAPSPPGLLPLRPRPARVPDQPSAERSSRSATREAASSQDT